MIYKKREKHINVTVVLKKLKNKKKELNRKKFHTFIIENGEMQIKMMSQKI